MNRIKQKVFLFINFILLSIVYFVGIGFTFVFAKILGKKFLLSKNSKNSNFLKFKESTNLEKMF